MTDYTEKIRELEKENKRHREFLASVVDLSENHRYYWEDVIRHNEQQIKEYKELNKLLLG